jgi:hypothetical protein
VGGARVPGAAGFGGIRPEKIAPARCALLGYAPNKLLVEGTEISRWFLRVESQPEVGEEGYDAGARILAEFFEKQLKPFLADEDLNPVGRDMIEACLDGATVQQFAEMKG